MGYALGALIRNRVAGLDSVKTLEDFKYDFRNRVRPFINALAIRSPSASRRELGSVIGHF
jgi:hypothetical protein